MTPLKKTDARNTLKRNGKSFWFASLFLPRAEAEGAAQLYAFCRRMDDLADDRITEDPGKTLEGIRADLKRGSSTDSSVTAFLHLADRYKLPMDAADYLMSAFIEDSMTNLHIADDAQLVRYCYGVAGTVGLMMSPILGADGERAKASAIDLGIAMQMTNIARDVLEDAKNGRRYLPGSWVNDLSAAQIADHGAHHEVVSAAIVRLTDLADRYYAGAAQGFQLIPRRARRAIEIAATVYREIGMALRRHQVAWWQGRIYVPLWRKVLIAAGVCAGSCSLRQLPLDSRYADLHRPLIGLPGAV